MLFRHQLNDSLFPIFDNKGFSFTQETKNIYDRIKDQPHLYVAWTRNVNGYYYIGKSFQNGGRWKRQHAYHLGTLAYHLLGSINNYDQNHSHWIQHWTIVDSIKNIHENKFSIKLRKEVYISFIPFNIYANQNFETLQKSEIRQINAHFEKLLIQSYNDDNLILLNVQHTT